MHRVSVSLPEARRIALAAQGFDRARPAAASDVRHFRRALQNIAVLQLDFVNVLVPAHFLMIFSRLGIYDRARFESYLYDSGEYIEQWAHEASVVPSNHWPLLAHRRREFEQWKASPIHKMPDKKAYLRGVLRQVRDSGPITSHDLPAVDAPKRKPGDWHRSIPRWALEHHFGRGKLAVRRRLSNFQRVYDLPQRLIDDAILSTRVSQSDAERALLLKASTALGIATSRDLADYFRMSPRNAEPRIGELVESGDLVAVDVEGWGDSAYLAAGARSPRAISGASLLSPFDPVVWFRPRAERLFDFEYRIEIYVPEAKRQWGYYVLPFRLGDRIVARIDLKADRKASSLLVRNAHIEKGADLDETVTSLTEELGVLARWLGLARIQVTRMNTFSRTLAQSVPDEWRE